MNRLTLASVAALCGLTAACAKKEAPADTTAAAPAPAAAAPAPAAPMATVDIVSPKEGDSTTADVKVVLTKQNVTIEKASGAKADGVGHYHLFLDTIPVADGVVIPPNSKHTVHIGTGDSTYTFKGLTPGAHQLIAVIGYGDHSAMPEKRDTVNFVVKK
ncbi:MAG TPA: DUF4399 domain-containing protein [Gemmatimonadaceae bacterium]|jgi:hypothetical protein